jgi:hypothetical protein
MHLKKLVKLLLKFFLHQFSFQQFFDHLKQVHQVIVHQNVLRPNVRKLASLVNANDSGINEFKFCSSSYCFFNFKAFSP